MKNSKNPGVKADLIALGLLFGLILLFFSRLFFPEPQIFATSEIGANDIWYLNFPLKNFLNTSLKAGQLPVWDPYRNNGFPDLAEGQIGTFNWYNLLAFRFLPPIHAFNLGFIVMFFQAALGMYLFARVKKMSRGAAFLTAFIWVLPPSTTISNHWPFSDSALTACPAKVRSARSVGNSRVGLIRSP